MTALHTITVSRNNGIARALMDGDAQGRPLTPMFLPYFRDQKHYENLHEIVRLFQLTHSVLHIYTDVHLLAVNIPIIPPLFPKAQQTDTSLSLPIHDTL